MLDDRFGETVYPYISKQLITICVANVKWLIYNIIII